MDSELECAWAAGFFDGEGCTTAYLPKGKHRYTLQCSVTQIHRATLERFQRAIDGVGVIYGPYFTKSGVHGQYTIKFTGQRVMAAFALLRPYLSTPKIDQFEEAIRKYLSTPPSPKLSDRERRERRRAYQATWARRKRMEQVCG